MVMEILTVMVVSQLPELVELHVFNGCSWLSANYPSINLIKATNEDERERERPEKHGYIGLAGVNQRG